MALQWYYKVLGQETGPVSSSELKELAESGFLTPDVEVRKGAAGDWVAAGQVRGLFDGSLRALLAQESDTPPEPAAAAEAPVAAPEDPIAPPEGPVEADGRAALRAGPEPQAPLPEPEPADVDWYCQAMGREIGPLSRSALEALAETGFLTREALVRCGPEGDWVPGSEVPDLFGDEPLQPAAQVEPAPPPPPAEPALPVAKPLDPVEPATPKKPAAQVPGAAPPTREAAWYYQAMGEEVGPLSAADLKELAATGFVTEDVLVRRGKDGRWVPANQIKGLFGASGPTVPPQPKQEPQPKPKPKPRQEPEELGLAPLPESELPRSAARRAPTPQPSRPPGETRWYYEVEGRAQGPLSDAELKERAASGKLAPGHLVRKGRNGNWVPAQQVRGLFPKGAAPSKRARPPAGRGEPPGKSDAVRSLRCPDCGRQFQVWGDMANKPMKCPCGRVLQAGAQGAAPAPSAPASGGLLDSAFDEMQSGGAAGAPSVGAMGSFLDEALDDTIPLAEDSPNPFQSPGTTLPPAPRASSYATSSTYAEDTYRPRRGSPGMTSRVIVGGFMTFIGGLGVVAFLALLVLIGVGLVMGGSQITTIFTGMSREMGPIVWFGLLVRLGVLIVAAFSCFLYLSGGIGILRGESAGAEKGATASGMSLGIVGVGFLYSIIVVLIAAHRGGAPAPAVIGALIGVSFVSVLQCIMPAALLFWCNKYGPRLPR